MLRVHLMVVTLAGVLALACSTGCNGPAASESSGPAAAASTPVAAPKASCCSGETNDDAAAETADAKMAETADAKATETADPKDEDEDGWVELSPADRAAAKKQGSCPVTGEKLGSMGTPHKATVKGRTVFLCCDGCESRLKKDPDKYLAQLDSQAAPDEKP
jgi:YHS domain-containing protein